MNPFEYKNTTPDFKLKLIESNRHRSRYAVSFQISRPTAYPEHNTASGEYYLPSVKTNKFPLTILVHGLGDNSATPCRMIAEDLAKKGIASFIIFLVFHSRRMPKSIRAKLPYLSQEEWFEGYRTSVIDIRQIIDWAHTREEINKDQITVTGISLGGIISAISMGVDKRINAGIFIVAGGNYESRTWLRRGRNKLTEEDCIKAADKYNEYLKQVAEKGFENVLPDKQSYLTDPVTFAYLLKGRPLLMINASWDERIPRQSSVDMWESFEKPPIKWYPATHSTLWMWYPGIKKIIFQFFTRVFNVSLTKN